MTAEARLAEAIAVLNEIHDETEENRVVFSAELYERLLNAIGLETCTKCGGCGGCGECRKCDGAALVVDESCSLCLGSGELIRAEATT